MNPDGKSISFTMNAEGIEQNQNVKNRTNGIEY